MTKYTLLISDIAKRLKQAGIDNPLFESKFILSKILEITKEEVFLQKNFLLDKAQKNVLEDIIFRRCANEPLSKIFQEKEFWSLPFKTTHDTLDPRPESEVIIEQVLISFPNKSGAYKILDLGTGTGCLLISLLKEFPSSIGAGVDISKKALDVARENVIYHEVQSRCNLIHSNWDEKLHGEWDIIVSNPPYVNYSDYIDQSAKYDPSIALFAEEEGYRNYRIFANSLKPLLADKGKLFLEIGKDQESKVKKLFLENNWIFEKEVVDLQKIVRAMIFKKS